MSGQQGVKEAGAIRAGDRAAGSGCAGEVLFRRAADRARRRGRVTSAEQAAGVVGSILSGLQREVCLAIPLSATRDLLDVVVVSLGTANDCLMPSDDIYREAIRAGAAGLVVAHNHPSGDAEASARDRAVTRRLAQAGELVGVELLDHLVVAGDGWTSLARRGVIRHWVREVAR